MVSTAILRTTAHADYFQNIFCRIAVIKALRNVDDSIVLASVEDKYITRISPLEAAATITPMSVNSMLEATKVYAFNYLRVVLA